jgi:2-polyprenyl-3-methyl-5-hydroxy-6-metoxy-1,4-benzoquinol methylase
VLNNLINRHDALRLYGKLRQGEISQILAKLQVREPDRVLAHWSDASVSGGQVPWGEIPAVRRRWHAVAGNGGEMTFPQHAASTWLAGRPDLRALSLGCGTGGREIEWARLGVFGHITGIDVSLERVEQAASQAKEAGLADVLSFRAAAARQVLGEGEQFDVVLALQSLHHFNHAGETMGLIAGALSPGGLLIFDEYVGPDRFQWARAQVRAANALLAALPAERRMQRDGHVKHRVIRPSVLSMRLDDPSEAVESSDLLPALHQHFTILEAHPYGSVLHLALHGIAHNFLGEDAATGQAVQQCLAAEDEALAHLGHDYLFAICAPRDQSAAESPGRRVGLAELLSFPHPSTCP